MEERWKSIVRDESKEKCVEETARNKCLRRRMEQTMSDMVGVGNHTARERQFLMLRYDLTAKRTRAVGGA